MSESLPTDDIFPPHLAHSVRRLTEDEPLAHFHQQTWGRDPHEIFRLHTVDRSDQPHMVDNAVCRVPSHCLVFEGFDMGLRHRLTHILVRREYVEGLLAISEFSKRPLKILTQYFGTSRDVDLDGPGTLLHYPHSPHFSEGDREVEDDGAGGVSVAGHPAIGKSLFLQYTLVNRLLARRTTIWIDEEANSFIFHEEGVFQLYQPSVALARELTMHLHPSTWCLVDSSPSFPSVPQYVLHLDVFILQAASSSPKSFDWLGRTGNRTTTKFYMKPWTLTELIAARQWHLDYSGLDEDDIARSFGICAPSPPLVFSESINPDYGHTTKACVLNLLSQASFSECVRCVEENDFHHQAHTAFVLRPGDTRGIPQVTLPTRHACNSIEYAGPSRIQRLVNTLHAPADFVLESIIRRKFSKGGRFALGAMRPVEDPDKAGLPTSWTFNVLSPAQFRAKPDAWLHVGYPSRKLAISTEKISSHESPSPPSLDGLFSPLSPVTPITPHFLFPTSTPPPPVEEAAKPVPIHSVFNAYQGHNDPSQLRTGFIVPQSRFTTPYDFIAYNAEDKTAVILEAFYVGGATRFTISMKAPHWLAGNVGIQKLTYVAVLLGPAPGMSLEWDIPYSLAHVRMEKYVSLHDRYGVPWA